MKLNSVRLPHFAASAEKATVKLKTPSKVIISMSQHGGVPCKPVVNTGDEVKTGQLIGDCDAVMSAPIHSSVTGTVVDKINLINIYGKVHEALVIETVPNQVLSEDIRPPVINSREDFISAIKQSGLVGLGGGGFPTHLKFNYDRNSMTVDTLIINGAECEPYITSDYRTFIEEGEKIADGIRLIMKYVGINRAYIGIEADKPTAIKRMTELTASDDNITVVKLPSSYPQGAEKVLIYNVTGKIVKKGELPAATGCGVLNCSTAAFISDYIRTGIPLIKRRITVDGNIVNKPQNFFVPIGTRVSDIIFAADLRVLPDRGLLGGPMMGTAFYDVDTPISKTTNAVLLFSDTKVSETTACIRCGRCVRACSMGLMPTELEHAYDRRDVEMLRRLHIDLCMNCGACSYVCPAKRSLSEKNQLAKILVKKSSAIKQ